MCSRVKFALDLFRIFQVILIHCSATYHLQILMYKATLQLPKLISELPWFISILYGNWKYTSNTKKVLPTCIPISSKPTFQSQSTLKLSLDVRFRSSFNFPKLLTFYYDHMPNHVTYFPPKIANNARSNDLRTKMAALWWACLQSCHETNQWNHFVLTQNDQSDNSWSKQWNIFGLYHHNIFCFKH